MELPLAQSFDQQELWNRMKPVNRVTATDTYKRTMAASSDAFSKNLTAYTLAARRSIGEPGADGRLIMAGLEKTLYPWFIDPISQAEVNRAAVFFLQNAQMRKFPLDIWNAVACSGGRMPIDIWSLPGGQTFLAKDGKHVPMMSVEGPGALVTHLEPHLEMIFAPIIHATKAGIFSEAVGEKLVEFGLRSDQNINNHVALMLSLYVGGGIYLTSDDQAAFIFREYFKDVGTIGHEFIMAYQRDGVSLADAQDAAFEEFVAANERSSLLPDVINTIKSGLPAILKLVLKYKGTNKVIMPRFDSGDIPAQCVHWKKMTLAAGFTTTQMVVEDGMNPAKGKAIKAAYAAAGYNPEDITIGAGGYFQDGCSRDGASLVYKRSATWHGDRWEPSMKFSDSPGKESIPGRIRVYEDGDALIIAQAGEKVNGTLLMQKVVDQGKIVYTEDLKTQRQRARRTWNQYATIRYSPETEAIIQARTKERDLLT